MKPIDIFSRNAYNEPIVGKTCNFKEGFMKRMIMFAGILCVLFVTACAGGSPSSAARKFYAAVEKNDTNAMRNDEIS
jgi:hypothetical protein